MNYDGPKISYLKMINYIVDYLNEHKEEDEKPYYHTELYHWNDEKLFTVKPPYDGRSRVYGIITNENPVSDETFQVVADFIQYGDSHALRNIHFDIYNRLIEYIVKNNIIICYSKFEPEEKLIEYINDRANKKQKYEPLISKKYMMNTRNAWTYFTYIDFNLLNNVIDEIDEKQKNSLTRKLFNRYK